MKPKSSKRILASLLMVNLAASAAAQDKPNVVLMLTDNVGWGDIGALKPA